MKNFQKTVLSTALILLIVILTAFAILLRTSKASLIYPPMLTVCPDQYKISTDGSSCVLNSGINGKYPSADCKNAEYLLTWKPDAEESMEDKPSLCCPPEFLISDYKSLTHSQKKEKFKKDCPKGDWDGLTNLNWGMDNKPKKDNSKFKIKKEHIIIFLLVSFVIGYFAFL
tara:strand:- start:15 stop:527 length:513 start_codon:yes stop_codon:yes gene_type:complete